MSLCRGSFLVIKFWYQDIAAYTVISVYRKSFGKMKAFGEDHTVTAVCRSYCAGEQLSIPHEHPRTLDIACGHFLLTIRTIHQKPTSSSRKPIMVIVYVRVFMPFQILLRVASSFVLIITICFFIAPSYVRYDKIIQYTAWKIKQNSSIYPKCDDAFTNCGICCTLGAYFSFFIHNCVL